VSDPITVRLADSDSSRTLDFALVRGTNVDVAVVDAAGAPVANAIVVDGVTDDGRQPRRLLTTQRDGHVRIPLANGTQKMVYVLPRDGSIASFLLRDPHEVKLVVPAGASALRLRALLQSGEPLSGLEPRIRLNGELIPDAVLRLYAQHLGIQLATDAAGELLLPKMPAGLYELTLDKRGNEWARVAAGNGETTVIQRFGAR